MRPLAAVVVMSTMIVGGIAAADDPAPNRLEVTVGKTVERDVGYARGGWFCDDTTLVTGDLITRKIGDRETNFWVVTGVKAGTTQCRVGNDQHRLNLVFDLVVTAAKQKAK